MATLNPTLSATNLDVTGRVFVVTGGTQGLGLAIARFLKGNGAAGLVLVSRSQAKGEKVCKELQGDDGSCTVAFVSADLSKAEDASAVVPKAAEAMSGVGPISGLVNAAATTGRGNLLTTTAEDFDMQMALNVRAPFLVSQGVAKHMIENNVKGGSIVNICSVAALGGAPFIMAYSAAKAALSSMTKNNAAELAPKGIRVNGVNMGWCLTENEDKLQRQNSGDDWAEKADAGVPIGRILRPEDVAATVGFLLSDASAMMTGSVVGLHPEYSDGMLSLVADENEGR
uniref:Ketoreductase domain-containing protein n=1 Tax=Helicotheca tamesis TaxID=374047 RepID=A0A7S2HYS1_9STRA|mmetsp:Transcript_4094/g.5539  ORF Transcript_4094/g.5539 Transcript_4094/m.5539 type:complete len:285 (+) Transcript_4094:57-911(+)